MMLEGSVTTESESQPEDRIERRKLISRIYTIVIVQLILCLVIVFAVNINANVRELLYDKLWIGYIFCIAGICFYIPLICFESVRRLFPVNWILLISMTLCYSIFGAILCVLHELYVVFFSILGTMWILVVMTIFARCTKIDFARPFVGMSFCVSFVAFLLLGLIVNVISISVPIPLIHLLFSGVVVITLSSYIVFVTQLIAGGKMCEIKPNETVFGVVILYTTVVQIFMHVLNIVGACFGENG
ncbi:protein LIFEGUARD 1 [Cimex lectularius]|uniref:Uncharacterized protein n=1 Tax=Cimex lectularius TaxID=79782 RepID=A0A8I6RU78_CIMLE|nr:protein LIFEGUARD 1 [Cimex lectularius]